MTEQRMQHEPECGCWQCFQEVRAAREAWATRAIEAEVNVESLQRDLDKMADWNFDRDQELWHLKQLLAGLEK